MDAFYWSVANDPVCSKDTQLRHFNAHVLRLADNLARGEQVRTAKVISFF